MSVMMRFLILTVSALCWNVAYSSSTGFSGFVYKPGQVKNPFSGEMDNKRIYYESSCRADNFPVFNAVQCTPEGKLEVSSDEAVVNDTVAGEVQGSLVGLFFVNGEGQMLLALQNAASVVDGCGINDTYVLPLAGDTRNTLLRTAVNALILEYTVQLNIQGCALGRAKVISLEVLNCTSKKCRSTLQTPLMSMHRKKF